MVMYLIILATMFVARSICVLFVRFAVDMPIVFLSVAVSWHSSK